MRLKILLYGMVEKLKSEANRGDQCDHRGQSCLSPAGVGGQAAESVSPGASRRRFHNSSVGGGGGARDKNVDKRQPSSPERTPPRLPQNPCH